MEEVLSFLNKIAEAEGHPLSPACLAYLRKVIKIKKLKKRGAFARRGGIV